jgi:hypothetical protein
MAENRVMQNRLKSSERRAMTRGVKPAGIRIIGCPSTVMMGSQLRPEAQPANKHTIALQYLRGLRAGVDGSTAQVAPTKIAAKN